MMADRKAELERKKAKLEQMRAERKRKQEVVEPQGVQSQRYINSRILPSGIAYLMELVNF